MQPTAPELEILKLLWQNQPRSARDLHDEIEVQFHWSYSSTRKTLERMGEKGLVSISSQGNKKLYTAQVDKVKTLASYAQDFARRIFELDGPLPVAMFADSKLIDDGEIADLEKLLKGLSDDKEA
ncbi:BlaI/MecI/CopY family transcriptional regulator [Psychrobium sp. MM17-31]|uniref:BlaI/MecI/CopY family transcriptional regulator n=1 Tax=Psychrobium sp. MM17-31 TaxID=2917758 RepID=UPI001EF6CC91|nr:BlaI/MecI/CopY family transcriptional regulator [Psychrobium sp. MM17-31]MCG7532788.1 BlaI/MecI/CopY family transcriptional regulator [Psychrobium sp. MM17-31]